jgi:hypothetical protein
VKRSSLLVAAVVRPKKSPVIVWLPTPPPGPRVGGLLAVEDALGDGDGLGVGAVVGAAEAEVMPVMVGTAAAPLERKMRMREPRRLHSRESALSSGEGVLRCSCRARSKR